MRYSLVAAAALMLAAGCHRRQECDAGRKSKLELHDGSGATTLSWKGSDLCDGQLHRVATIETKGSTVTVTDPNGRLRLEITKEAVNSASGRDAEGPRVRSFRDGHELRVQRGDGVPYGSVVPEGKKNAVIYNPASSPIAKVSLRDNDAVVTDMGGTALDYVVPSKDAGLAGIFGIPKLDPVEQLALYIYWSR